MPTRAWLTSTVVILEGFRISRSPLYHQLLSFKPLYLRKSTHTSRLSCLTTYPQLECISLGATTPCILLIASARCYYYRLCPSRAGRHTQCRRVERDSDIPQLQVSALATKLPAPYIAPIAGLLLRALTIARCTFYIYFHLQICVLISPSPGGKTMQRGVQISNAQARQNRKHHYQRRDVRKTQPNEGDVPASLFSDHYVP
jgi:hypothetical protein